MVGWRVGPSKDLSIILRCLIKYDPWSDDVKYSLNHNHMYVTFMYLTLSC